MANYICKTTDIAKKAVPLQRFSRRKVAFDNVWGYD